MASTITAKKLYAAKVCKSYLGIGVSGCERAFDDCLANMRRGYEALKRE